MLVAAGNGADSAGDEEETTPSLPSAPAEQADNETTDDADAEDVKNPKLKKLSDEAAHHRNVAKAEKERADKAEAELRDARVENAFTHAAIGMVDDTDAAWKLADKSAIVVGDDGQVTGADEAVAAVLEKYPYLKRLESDDGTGTTQTQASGRPPTRKRTADVNRAILETKFPALQYHR